MASGGAGAVRAGGAFVEIFAKDGQFQQSMTRIENRIKALGSTMRRVGTGMAIGGAAIGAPMVLAARQAAGFEDALLGMKAAAGLTVQQVARLEQEAIKLSKSMGSDPAKIANAFLELTKAGMSVEEVLAGAGKSAVEFARVSGVEMADAAVFMKVAMNSFGVTATQAVDTLSAAADASETSIAAMVESFALVGSAGVSFNQSLFDISQGLAALARFGIRGEEAGTGIKTMLTRLVSPSKEAEEALGKLGLSVESFRDADGKMLPLAQVAQVFADKMGAMDDSARDLILSQRAVVDVFGERGIKVISAFTQVGKAGFDSLATAMEGNLPVSVKFGIMMSGLSGAFEKLGSSVARLSISFAKALGNSLDVVVPRIQTVLSALGALLEQFPIIAKVAAATAASMVVLGAALIAAGISVQIFGRSIGIAAKLLQFLATPVGLATAAVVGGIALMLAAAYQLSPAFRKEADGIMAALSQLDFKTAWEIMNLNLAIAMTQMAGYVQVGLQRIGNFFAATGSVISDTMIGALDSFMGIFGADIVTLQSGLQKLGIYLRAAFNWKFAVTGMRAAIAEVEAEAERARNRAPTAAARAKDRTARREAQATARGKAEDATTEGYEATLAELRADLDRAHNRLKEKPPAPAQESTVKRSEFREPMATEPVVAAEKGKTGIGATLGTFSSSGDGLGIGPELNKLEDYGRQTAENTGLAAKALAAMIEAKNDPAINTARGLPDSWDPNAPPGGGDNASSFDIVGAQLEAALSAAGALAKGEPDQAAGRGVAESAAAAAAAAASAVKEAAAAPGGVGAEAAARKIPEAGNAAAAGAASAGKSASASSDSTRGFTDVVNAINAHAALTAAGNKILERIAARIPNAQGAFA